MGRKPYSTVTEIEALPKKNVEYINASKSGTLPAGQVEIVYVYAPAGKIATINAIYLGGTAMVGATGSHDITVLDQTNSIAIMNVSSLADKNVTISGRVASVYDTAVPADEQTQNAILGSLVCSETEPLVVRYFNNSDTNQTADRGYTVSLITEETAK